MDERALPALDLRQLYYFVILAEHGTISSAAAALGLAQPTLSENITRLERRLEAQLAIRGARGIQLTDAGIALANHARELVKRAEIAIGEVRQLGEEARGPVSVGIVPSLALQLSGPLAETIMHEYPLIRLRIAEVMSGDMLDWLETDQLELGCLYDTPQTATLMSEAIFIEDLLLVTAADNWKGEIGSDGRALEPIGAAALAQLPLVLPSSRHGFRKAVERFARANGIVLNVAMEMDSLPQIIGMVDRASAYTILPHAAVVDQVARGDLALVTIADPPIRRTGYVVRRRARPVTRASIAVEAVIKTIIRDMIERHRLDARLLPEK